MCFVFFFKQKTAYEILQRFGERKAESIVGDIITKGATIFGNNVNNAQAGPPAHSAFTTVSPISVAKETTEIAADAATEPQVETQLKGLVTTYNAPVDPVLNAN